MPAAMPHTSRMRRCSGGALNSRGNVDAAQADTCTIGPSRPIDAPVPMDSNAETDRARFVRSFRSTWPARAASM